MVQNHIRGILTMAKEQEAQQEQTIAGHRRWLENQLRKVQSRGDYSAWPSEGSANRIISLLEIVDSRAQKIAEQTEEIQLAHVSLDKIGASKGEPQEDGFAFAAYSLAGRIDDLGDKIAEQAKEIERLKGEHSLPDNKRKYQCKQCGYRFDSAKDNPNPAHSCDERSVCPECESLNW